jgi:hypothetical protein
MVGKNIRIYILAMMNGVFWDVTPCGSLRTGVSEELCASIIRVTRIV